MIDGKDIKVFEDRILRLVVWLDPLIILSFINEMETTAGKWSMKLKKQLNILFQKIQEDTTFKPGVWYPIKQELRLEYGDM